MQPCDRACHRGIGCGKRRFGEMSEWFKERAWKVRIPQKGIVGSNPAFSAVCLAISVLSEQGAKIGTTLGSSYSFYG